MVLGDGIFGRYDGSAFMCDICVFIKEALKSFLAPSMM